MVIPASGATLQFTQPLVFDASASPGVTQVVFTATAPGDLTETATAMLMIYGWIGVVPALPAGGCEIPVSVSIQSVASYSGGVSGTSPPVNVTVLNPLPVSDCVF